MTHKHNLRWSNIERAIYCDDDDCVFSINAEQILYIVGEHLVQKEEEQLVIEFRNKDFFKKYLEVTAGLGIYNKVVESEEE